MAEAGRSSGDRTPETEAYSEVTLADIVKVLHRRKIVLGAVFLVVVLVGVSVTARQLDYWLRLDAASTPEDPVSPNVRLNIALSVVLGVVMGVFLVFFVEWLSQYRAQNRRLEIPDDDDEPATRAALPRTDRPS